MEAVIKNLFNFKRNCLEEKDIENLGFKKISTPRSKLCSVLIKKKDDVIYSMFYGFKKPFFIIIDKTDASLFHESQDRKPEDCFRGYVKNKRELKKILKKLNIL